MRRLLLVAGASPGTPPPYYIDKGACPFECCVHGRWIANADTILYRQPDRNSGRVGVVKAGAVGEVGLGFSPYDDEAVPRCDEGEDCLAGELTSRPVSTWWVNVRDEQGLVEGWSDQPDNFDDKGACG
ncbi:MAG TPA: hypothetical protein VNN07_02320 [Candidatus Tectomicrobia bacterium]|nr:hypothetical protein [Candidatus Tectomicrobia bacterium]